MLLAWLINLEVAGFVPVATAANTLNFDLGLYFPSHIENYRWVQLYVSGQTLQVYDNVQTSRLQVRA